MSEDSLAPLEFVAPELEELNHLVAGYEFVSFIAKGGMGAVYLARQTSLDRLVAVKVLPPVLGENEEFKSSFETEAKLMAKLNHPNLIGIFDFGNVNGMLYIVMEYVKGKSLFHSAAGKMIEQETAVNIVCGVCEGLEHAHDAGMLHRDVKPANILLNKKAVPKIGDFGLARPSDMTETGAIFGTPHYSAPEVVGAPDKVDKRTDIFAVGVILYELMTGRLPSTPYESVTKFADSDARFDQVIKKAIHPDIEMRYDTVIELADALKEVVNSKSSTKLVTGGGQPRVLIGAGSSAESSGGMGLDLHGADAPKIATRASNGAVGTTLLKASSVQAVDGSLPLPRTGLANADEASTGKSKMVWAFASIFVLLGAIYFVVEMGAKRQKQNLIEARAQQEEAARVQAEKDKIARDKARRELIAKTALEKAERAEAAAKAAIVIHPLEQLEKVKEKLVNGERPMSEMPDTLFMRNDDSRILMYIETPMTWDDADAWAQDHGGYISVCATFSDLPVFSRKIPDGVSAVWVGAGNTAKERWKWIDGTPWADVIALRQSDKREFLALSSEGVLEAHRGGKKFPFFIEWRADGENPAELKARLERSAIATTEAGRSYPVGTVSHEGREYCLLNRSVSREKAVELAALAGGKLVAISNDDEKKWVSDIVKGSASSGESYWTAAVKKEELWSWQNGENWWSLNWVRNGRGKGEYAVYEMSGTPMFKVVNGDYLASGFIIEWSKDAENPVTSEDDLFTLADLRELKAMAKSLVDDEIKNTKTKHASIVSSLVLDLSSYKRSLKSSEAAEFGNDIDRMIKRIEAEPGFLALGGAGGLPEKAADSINYAMRKEKELITNEEAAIEKLREQCSARLMNLSEEMAAKGQVSMAALLKKEADATGQNGDDFIDYVK